VQFFEYDGGGGMLYAGATGDVQAKGPPVEQSRYGRLGGRVLFPRSGVQLSQRVGSIGIQFRQALGVVWIEDWRGSILVYR
jgi:hypothetical protein